MGLILPTLPQETTPSWAAVSSASTTGGANPVGTRDGRPVADLAQTCRRAEELGAGALWACDHLFWHEPVIECLTALTVAATATRDVTLGSCVLQLPLRAPGAVAKQAASIQLLSEGRLVLGVGVGSHEGEYDQAAADFHARGHRLDDGIGELRRSWATGLAPDGDATRYRQLPVPPEIPVWVGGSSEAALRRAAHLADGWIPLFVGVDDYEVAIERLAKEADLAGRASDAVVPSIVLFVSVGDDRDRAVQKGTGWMSSLYRIPPKAFARHLVAGDARHIAREIRRYEDAGARHVAIYVTDDEPLDQFGAIMAELGTPAPSPVPSTQPVPATSAEEPA